MNNNYYYLPGHPYNKPAHYQTQASPGNFGQFNQNPNGNYYYQQNSQNSHQSENKKLKIQNETLSKQVLMLNEINNNLNKTINSQCWFSKNKLVDLNLELNDKLKRLESENICLVKDITSLKKTIAANSNEITRLQNAIIEGKSHANKLVEANKLCQIEIEKQGSKIQELTNSNNLYARAIQEKENFIC